jgi:hypothetical protein
MLEWLALITEFGASMPKLNRIQYPVGQGGFFAEHHQTHYAGDGLLSRVIVYDCGSGRGVEPPDLLKEQIDNFNKRRRGPLDALVLSHFHLDHINGVSTLLDGSLSKAKKPLVFIPYLTDEEQELITLEALLPPADDDAVQPPLDTKTVLEKLNVLIPWTLNRGQDQSGIKVVEIESKDHPAESSAENSEYYGTLATNVDTNAKISHQISVRLGNKKDNPLHVWILKFFCKKAAPDAITATRKELEKCGINFSWLRQDREKLVDWLGKTEIKKIHAAYAQITGSVGRHNLASLCCYSGPVSHVAPDPFDWFGPWIHLKENYRTVIPSSGRIGWLGTGDLNLKDPDTREEFRQHYKALWRFVGTIQIPHHGASRDSDEHLFDDAPIIATVHYGKNTYGHPDEHLLAAALKKGVIVCPVTDQPETGLHQPLRW